MDDKIDFVVLWVDGNDPEWQKERSYYIGDNGDKRSIRFRDWDNLQYWFRAVEKFAPWVNKIHFVTWGHLPYWLNTEHPKINIVKHDDFLDPNHLPTFNSRAIEINLHKIKGLSEKFVYFNDDTFIIKPVKKELFFKKNLPRDAAIPDPTPFRSRLGIGCAISNNMEIINTRFSKRQFIKDNLTKWFNPIYKKRMIASFCMIPWDNFPSFATAHIPHSYLKSTFNEVWEKEEEVLRNTSNSRFRSKNNVNQWLMRYWQLASGNFIPRSVDIGKNFMLSDNNKDAVKAIEEQKFKLICLNDTVNIKNFEKQKDLIKHAFNNILPEQSAYELWDN